MLLNIMSHDFLCVVCTKQQASWPLSIRQITDFILLLCSSFLMWEFGVGNEIGGHQLLCEVPDDLIVAARHIESLYWMREMSARYFPDGVTT